MAFELALIPRRTWIHHHILGTPLQYLAIALMLCRPVATTSALPPRKRLAWMPVCIALLLLVRLFGVGDLVLKLSHGKTSAAWDPAFTELGRFAAQKGDDSYFLAVGWGVAVQVYCLSNGQPDLIEETFWAPQAAPDLVRRIQETGKTTLYLIDKRPASKINPRDPTEILQVIQQMPGWQEVPPEPQTAAWKAVWIRKFVRTEAP